MPKENRAAAAIDRVTSMIALQASLNPSAAAISGGRETLSYAELNQRASRLAHLLCARGVGRDVAVGIYFERAPAMVVAALAVLKAGGAFLPLDPAQPVARLALMLKDSAARVVISTARMAERLPAGSWQLIALDGDEAKISAQPASEPSDEANPDDLAYIIYTSGSTGEPKGVEITHRGLSNLIAWHRRAFQVTGKDRASSLAALGFDAAIWEIWPYLCHGASVFLAEERVRSDASALRDWLVSRAITISFAPTAMAETLLALEWPKNTALRYLLTGADVLKKYPAPGLPFTLVNNYGPTESTVVSTSGSVSSDGAATSPSIGYPIDGVQVYILDEQRNPVAEGEKGEIYIAGASLARGYRNRPEMTAQRFVVNPFSGEAAARLYRTGDLGRQLPSGGIAFLGRIDEQVKIRGYRVEPGEVAAILGQHESVRSAIVVALDGASQAKELAAYVVAAPAATLSASGLRNYLLQRLPDYMVPSDYVALDSFPLTTNGKIDRAALPDPNGNRLRDQAYLDPRTPVEEELVGILGPLLRLDRVGVNDNFFLLGGHSLLGTQLIARVSEAFGVDLTLLKLFDHPTIAGMAEEIENLILAKVEAESRLQSSAKLSPAFSGVTTRSVV